MTSTILNRCLTVLFLILNGLYSLSAQFNPLLVSTHQGNSNVLYQTSNCTDAALRFFIFDDGLFSFENNPTHVYAQANTTHNAKAWLIEPYDHEDPALRTATNTIPQVVPVGSNPELFMGTNPQVINSWSAVQNKQHYYVLMFTNTTAQTISGCLDFFYNTSQLNLNTAGILQYNGWVTQRTVTSSTAFPEYNRLIKWNFSNLLPNEKRMVYIPMTALGATNTKLKTASRVRVNCGNSGDLVAKETTVHATPHDPNHKSVDRACSGWPMSGYVPQQLAYRIDFKNIGNGVANNVTIIDQLSTDFDLATLKFISSEYPYTYQLNGNILTISFPDIKLPGSKQTVPYIYSDDMSESWIEFSICTKNYIPSGKSIANGASIFFDNQPGIATNTVGTSFIVNCAQKTCGASGPTPAQAQLRKEMDNGNETVSLAPNPVSAFATLNAYSESSSTVNIYNSNAALVKQLNFNRLEGQTQIDVSELPAGMYMMKVKSAEINVSLKLIKL